MAQIANAAGDAIGLQATLAEVVEKVDSVADIVVVDGPVDAVPLVRFEVVVGGQSVPALIQGNAIFLLKTVEQADIGAAYADVAELSFEVQPYKNYEFDFTLFAKSDAATTGIDVAVNGPAAPLFIAYTQLYWTSTTAVAYNGAGAYDHDTASGNSNGLQTRPFRIFGILRTGANGGLLTARIKREAVGSGPTVLAGSFGRITELI